MVRYMDNFLPRAGALLSSHTRTHAINRPSPFSLVPFLLVSLRPIHAQQPSSTFTEALHNLRVRSVGPGCHGRLRKTTNQGGWQPSSTTSASLQRSKPGLPKRTLMNACRLHGFQQHPRVLSQVASEVIARLAKKYQHPSRVGRDRSTTRASGKTVLD